MPPVTVLKSLPAARITGALSPVIALSLIEATPSITSPSPGMRSPCSTSTRSPLRSVARRRQRRRASRCGSASFFAIVSLRALLSEAACALLRPSAIASAKLANSSVTQSQRVTARMNPAALRPCRSAPGARGSSSECCRCRRRTSPDCATDSAASVAGSCRSARVFIASDRRTRTARSVWRRELSCRCPRGVARGRQLPP